MKVCINYQGKTLHTKFYQKIPDELFMKLKKDYYAKPSVKEVLLELDGILNKNKTKIANITRYFFRDLMAKVCLYHSKWSIEDVFNYKPLLEYFVGVVLSNSKVYPPSEPLIKNIETAFRIGGKGVVSKPTNFRLKIAKQVLSNYNLNNNYLDMSCGWGVRLLAALSLRLNYFGTDPNCMLVERLHQLYNLCKEVVQDLPAVDIRCQGSEFFIQEWENKMGVAFTSPPYYNLEDYRIGNQSTKLYKTYKDWLDFYYYPTILNTYRYLIDKGHMLINIKNFKGYTLEEDTIRIAKSVGFEYLGNLKYSNIKRCNPQKGLIDNNENIYVFCK